MLKIYTLGGLVISKDDEKLDSLTSQKARALLVYLAITGRSHPRAHLSELLWGDIDDHQGHANLRRELTALRRNLPDHLRQVGDRVEIVNDPASCWSDCAALAGELDALGTLPEDRSLLPAEVARLEHALSLYQGDLLDNFQPYASPHFEQWLQAERKMLRLRVINALRRTGESHLAHGKFQAGIMALTRLLQIDPMDDDAHRRMMQLLMLTGQRGAALSHYEEYEALCHSESNPVQPNEAVTALAQSIRDRTTPEVPPSLALHNLPVDNTPFIGRARELAELTERLTDPECRLITLVGLSGMGKTRLALKSAEQHVASFRDGVYYVALAPLDQADSIGYAIAEELGLTVANQTDRDRQLVDFVSSRHLLLVLDNFEHVMEGRTLLVRLLEKAPQLKILVTSQKPLSLYGEWLLPVRGMDIDQPPSQAVEDAGAVQLFARAAQRVVPSFTINGTLPCITRICTLVDGMPLAIELAAAWMHVFSCTQIAEHIEHDLEFLTSQWANLPERHRSIRTLFDWAWRLLPEPEQRALTHLSVFRGGFTLEAAAEIASAPLPVVTALVQKSLVQSDTRRGRFEMHGLLQQFAGEKLVESGEYDQVREMHRKFFTELAAQAEPQLRSSEQNLWLDKLETERGNLSAALEWCREHPSLHEQGLQLASALEIFWRVRGYLEEGRRWLESTFTAPMEAISEIRAKALVSAGMLAYTQSDYDRAETLLKAGLALYRELENQAGIGNALNGLGAVHRDRGNYAEAMKYYDQALAVHRVAGDPFEIGETLNSVGLVAAYEGHYGQATRYFTECREYWERAHNPRGLARVINNMGLVAYYQAQFDLAENRCQEALKRFQSLGDKWGCAIVLVNLGRIAIEQADYERGILHCRQSLFLSQEIGYQENIAECLEALAAAMGATNQPERGAQFLGYANHLRQKIGAPLPVADKPYHERTQEMLQRALGAERFDGWLLEGAASHLPVGYGAPTGAQSDAFVEDHDE